MTIFLFLNTSLRQFIYCFCVPILAESRSVMFKTCRSDFSLSYRCLCAVSKVAGKGATVVEYLIQVFFKRLDSQAVDNKQVGCCPLETWLILTTLK